MDLRTQLTQILDQALNLEGRIPRFDDGMPLLGAVPELDSMGVVVLLTALEDQLGMAVEDDEIDGEVFATFGSLHAFVQAKLGG